MNELGERLRIIASFVPKGKSVCDVGTDHGYLPAALCLSGDCSSVTATDIRKKPLENASKNLKRLGVKNVELILCDGLQKVPQEKAQAVVIAGMGGDVISGIIDRCPYKEKPDFILSPTTGASTLREYLAENGFTVEREVAVSENGKIYSVMLCRFDGKIRHLSPAEKRIGKLDFQDEAGAAYIKKQLSIIEKCIFDLEKSGKRQDFLSENIMAKQEILNKKKG